VSALPKKLNPGWFKVIYISEISVTLFSVLGGFSKYIA